MKFLLFIVLALTASTLAQTKPLPTPYVAPEKPATLTLTAQQLAPLKIAQLEAENAKLRIAVLRQQLQEAETASQGKEKAAVAALSAMLAPLGIKPEDLTQFELEEAADGSVALRRKPVIPKS